LVFPPSQILLLKKREIMRGKKYTILFNPFVGVITLQVTIDRCHRCFFPLFSFLFEKQTERNILKKKHRTNHDRLTCFSILIIPICFQDIEREIGKTPFLSSSLEYSTNQYNYSHHCTIEKGCFPQKKNIQRKKGFPFFSFYLFLFFVVLFFVSLFSSWHITPLFTVSLSKQPASCTVTTLLFFWSCVHLRP